MNITIARCIRSAGVSQNFGENKSCVRVDSYGQPVRPFIVEKGVYSAVCPINSVKFYPVIGLKGHNGIDRPCWFKEPGYFDTRADCRFFAKTEIDQDGGVGVDVVSDRPVKQCTEPGCNEMHYIKRRYWHLWESLVFDGEEVWPGKLIFRADSTGASSGNHVHDATKWCDKDGNGIHTDNGYSGAFDDADMRVDIFILDYLATPAVQAEIKDEIVKHQMTLLDLIRKLIFKLSESLKGR